MEKKIRVAIVGLDTSHAVEFPKLMQDPSVPEENRIGDLITTRCLRFETPFQNKVGLDARQKYLESIGVMVTEDFDTAVADCDAILIEINDPAYHLEYFEKCAKLGKKIFLDKPFADTLENSRKIIQIAKENNVEFFTASSLRFAYNLAEALNEKLDAKITTVWGPVGHAPAGSSIVWYGVHAFEMLQVIMGKGAATVQVLDDNQGLICHVNYSDGRRGIVELSPGVYQYGGVIRNQKDRAIIFNETYKKPLYYMLLLEIVKFFKDNQQIVKIDDSFEVMSMLEAAEKSYNSKKAEVVYKA